jgi:hypothetical protein
LKTVARKLANCDLDLVGVQEISWKKGDGEQEYSYSFFYVNEKLITTGQTLWYLRESYQQLRRKSLLVRGYQYNAEILLCMILLS